MMPRQKPGRSRQDYETPDDLMRAVVARWGKPSVDLAATHNNSKSEVFISPEQDSLNFDWTGVSLAWLNPPYGHIAPWAKKCAESGEHILLLVPASVGSEWFARYVYQKARVFFLRGRLTFKGETKPYIKDCMICEYGSGFINCEVWDWRGRKAV